MQIVLIGLVVVFVVAAGYLFSAGSSASGKQTQLKSTLNQDQVLYTKGLAQKTDLETTAADLAGQLAAAQASAAASAFRSSAPTIDYDTDLFSLVPAGLNITGITSGPPVPVTVQTTVYKVTTFTVAVAGLPPVAIFKAAADDVTYLNSVVNSILAFKTAVANSSDFDTAVIKPVNITEPAPMNDAAFQAMLDNINSQVAAQPSIAAAIKALTAQITLADAGETSDQVAADVTAATAKLIAQTITAASPDYIAKLIANAGVPAPSATLIISIWTY